MSCCNFDEELLAKSDAARDMALDVIETAQRGYYAHFVVRDGLGSIVDADLMKVIADSYEEAVGKVYLALRDEFPDASLDVRVDEDSVILLSSVDIATLVEGLVG